VIFVVHCYLSHNNISHTIMPFFIFLLCLYSSFLGLRHFFSFLSLYTVGRAPWTVYQPVTRPLPTHRTTQTQNKHIQTSMPWVGIEPTIPAFEQAKTVRAATVIVLSYPYQTQNATRMFYQLCVRHIYSCTSWIGNCVEVTCNHTKRTVFRI
jgi:hypothetical protein